MMRTPAVPSPAHDPDVVRDPADVVGALVESHRELLGFLQRRVGDRVLAEDLLQAAFVKGIERADQLRDGESVLAWFYRILRNAVVDHYRRAGASERRLDALARELQDEETVLPDAQAALCRCVAPLVDTLKPEYAAALRRVELEGAAVKDFAEEAGITANNAAVRVFRAREALRKQVERSCGTCAEHGCLDCSCRR
jgi:RNA polymerase sigma factor (sigma-70 family)